MVTTMWIILYKLHSLCKLQIRQTNPTR